MRSEEERRDDIVSSTSGASGAKNKVLVAYFSHSGNTREVARQVHEKAGGDLFEIAAVEQYPSDYDEVVEKARKELAERYLPELKAEVENADKYGTIFVGYPNWWGTIPRPVAAFLSELELSGKIVMPFCTHEGSGLGRSVEDIKELCPRSTVREGLAIRGRDAKKAQKRISEWLAMGAR